MNIANPCKTLLLLGAVVFGMNASAEGTLPFAEGTLPFAEGTLPFALSNDQLPFSLNGRAYEVNGGAPLNNTMVDVSMQIAGSHMPVADKLRSRCRAYENAFPAQGTVIVGEESFRVQAICAPAGNGPRQILAQNAGRVLQFDGTFLTDGAARPSGFNGELKRTDNVMTSPEGGSTNANTMIFELRVGN